MQCGGQQPAAAEDDRPLHTVGFLSRYLCLSNLHWHTALLRWVVQAALCLVNDPVWLQKYRCS